MRWGRVLGAVSSLLVACGGSSGLEVDVRTDLVPIDEMAEVWLRVARTDGTGVPVERTYEVREGDDFLRGVRVASLLEVEHGELRLDVEVRDALGQVVLERPTLVTLDNDRAVTVLLTRDCRGVTCGDAGAPLACVSGACTDPRCTPETPELCNASECAVDADCTFAASCAVGVCSAGVCLAQPDDAMCDAEADLWCNPDEGCVPLPPLCPELEVVEVMDGTISGGTWPAAEYLLPSTLSVVDAPLVVEACSVLRVDGGIEVRDGAGLTLEGGPRMPITVTSTGLRPGRGDWGRLFIRGSSSGADNVFSHVTIEHGGGTSTPMVQIESGASVDITNSTFRASRTVALDVEGGAELRRFEGNVVTDNAVGLEVGPRVVASLGPGTYGPNDLDAIRVSGGEVNTDAAWVAHDAPYVIEGDLRITAPAGASARLAVGAGASLRLAAGRQITIDENGGLALEGTAEAPVSLRSASVAPARGEWNRLLFRGTSIATANRMSFAVVEHGGSSIYGMIEVESGTGISITDSTLRSSGTQALVVNGGATLDAFENNTVSDNASYGVEVVPSAAGSLGEGVYGPNDVEGISVTGGTLGADATWALTDAPYVLNGDVTISGASSAVLTVGPGVEVRVGAGREVRVDTNGALAMAGEAGAPILWTSASAAPTPGAWDQIRIFRASLGPLNVWRNARIEYGGGSTFGQVWLDGSARLALEAVTFAEAGMSCDLDLATGATLMADAMSVLIECP